MASSNVSMNKPSSNNSAKTKIHRFHAFVTGEAGIQASEPLTRNYGFISTASDISCSGIDGNNMLSHPILLTAYSGQSDMLTPTQMYCVATRMISNNSDAPDHFFHEISHRVDVGPAATFPGNLIDNTAVVSTGIVVDKYTIRQDAFGGKLTLVAIVRHTDYDPVLKLTRTFLVEYHTCPVRNLERAQGLIVQGGEVSFSGFFKDWDDVRKRWIIDVYTVTPTCGNEIIVKTGPAAAAITAGGRVTLPKRGQAAHTPTHPGAGVASGSGSGNITTAPVESSGSSSQASQSGPIDGVSPSTTGLTAAQDAAYLHNLRSAGTAEPPSKKPKK